jgi:hypothetical protein
VGPARVYVDGHHADRDKEVKEWDVKCEGEGRKNRKG